MSIRNKWILHVVLHHSIRPVFGVSVDYTFDSIMGTCCQHFFVSQLFVLLNRWTLMATAACYMLLSIFYYVVKPHDDAASSSLHFCCCFVSILISLTIVLAYLCSFSHVAESKFSFLILLDHGSNSITRLEI